MLDLVERLLLDPQRVLLPGLGVSFAGQAEQEPTQRLSQRSDRSSPNSSAHAYAAAASESSPRKLSIVIHRSYIVIRGRPEQPSPDTSNQMKSSHRGIGEGRASGSRFGPSIRRERLDPLDALRPAGSLRMCAAQNGDCDGQVVVVNWITLDGVMQAPGRPDEDTRNGFTHGGWAAPYTDASMGAKMGELTVGRYAWLFGRRSYEGLLASWNAQGGPFKDALNNTQKYVASSDSAAHLAWPNSTLLYGDVPAAVAELKGDTDANLVIMGSSILIQSLMAVDLIDQYVLMVAPIVLGTGRRLFAEGSQATLQLRDCTPASTGAVIVTYEPAQ